MDILNWLYLAKNKFVRTTLGSTKDLLVLGAKVGFDKRGDLYQNYAMSVEDFAKSSRGYKNLLISNITYTYDGLGGGTIVSYDILENTLNVTVELSVDNVGLKVYMPELDGVTINPSKLYIASQAYFTYARAFNPNLEESGLTGGSGVMYFVCLDLEALPILAKIGVDTAQLEIRIYN